MEGNNVTLEFSQDDGETWAVVGSCRLEGSEVAPTEVVEGVADIPTRPARVLLIDGHCEISARLLGCLKGNGVEIVSWGDVEEEDVKPLDFLPSVTMTFSCGYRGTGKSRAVGLALSAMRRHVEPNRGPLSRKGKDWQR